MLCVFVCLSVSMHRRILYPSAIPKRLYSISRTSSSCHYLFFPKKQIEPWKAERRIASCNAAGKDLCHPVPRRSLFIYLSVFVFSLQLPPSLAICFSVLLLLFKEIKVANSPHLSEMGSCFKPKNPQIIFFLHNCHWSTTSNQTPLKP